MLLALRPLLNGPVVWPVVANWTLKAGGFPFVGDFQPVVPSDQIPFTIDFANQISASDQIVSASSQMQVFFGVDPNASTQPFGSAGVAGTKVTQWAGQGWVPNVCYRLTMNAVTAMGAKIALYGHILCQNYN